MGVYSTTQAGAYADKIKAVYEYLDEIRKVADRLTPVADLEPFRTQIEAIYSKLDVLTETADVIAGATPTGEAILTGTVASIKTLLEIGVIPPDVVRRAELDSRLLALETSLLDTVGTLTARVQSTEITVGQIDQYRQIQQTEIEGLKIDYTNLRTGQEANQSNLETALTRLTVQEQWAAFTDQELSSINQSLTDTINGLQASNGTISGHTASLETLNNKVTLNTTSIDQLSSSLLNTDTNVEANTTALSLMQTDIQQLGNDLVVQSSLTNNLKSSIGGSVNLLPGSNFSGGPGGWAITVAEEDWANSQLTVNTFNMPEEVNTLEILGSPSPLGTVVVESPAMLLEQGKYYIVSGYPCVDNGTVVLSYKAYGNDGLVLDQGACPVTFNVTTNPSFLAYSRTWVKFLAPTGATKLRLYLTATGDGDFVTQVALFRPMVEQAWADQTQPSVWTPTIGEAAGSAEAYQNLETRVTQIDGEVDALALAQTALKARVDTAESALINEMITSANKHNAFATSINELDVRMTDAEGTVTAAAAVSQSMDARVTATEQGVSANAAAITNLRTEVDGDIASAIDSLNTSINTVDGRVTAEAQARQTLSTTVDGNTATISQHSTSINGLKAGWGVTLDVNGYISGLKSENNGTKADFTIVADSFKVVSPGHTPRTLFNIGGSGHTQFANDMYFGNGRIILDTGSHMKVSGIGFGVNGEFIEWFGPKMDIAACSRSNAISYLTRTGDGYFGGSLSAGILKNAATTTALDTRASVATSNFGTNGGPKTVVISFSYSNSGHISGDVSGTYNGASMSATIRTDRSYNSGAFTAVHTHTVTGTCTAIYDPELNRTHVRASFGGSITFVDNQAGTLNFAYMASITANSGPWPISIGGSSGSQSLSVVSTEG